jgi:dCTP deaminase
VIFLESEQVCEVSYADRGGKYQFQRGITIPRV